MSRFRQVCPMTRKPRRDHEMQHIVYQQCSHGFCFGCQMPYRMRFKENLWETEKSLCNNATIDELLDYSKYEV